MSKGRDSMDRFSSVGRSLPKIDALSLATGCGWYAADFPLRNPLHLAVLYSPHAHARILDIDISEAEAMKGVVDVLTFENVPRILYTTAGQGYPEPSPHDCVLLDEKVRFAGDRVAVVAAETRPIAEAALKRIRVEYQILEPVLDMKSSMEPSVSRIHDREQYAPSGMEYSPECNLAGRIDFSFGNIEEAMVSADFVEEGSYETQYECHCAIEPHAAVAFFDEGGRLVVVSSTQVPFHARRIVSRVLSIPEGRIRVIKPRIGGGFGGKQEVLLEPLVAMVAWRNRRPASLVLSRKEVFRSTRMRHPMRIGLRSGVMADGTIEALDMKVLLNAGAYAPHAVTVLFNCGGKVLPLLHGVRSMRFRGRSVYTTLPVGGAMRGYGAPQGFFALNQHLDVIAERVGRDVLELARRWHVRKGETSEVFRAIGEGGEGTEQVVGSCALDECLILGSRAIGWREKRRRRTTIGEGRTRGVGMAVAMQGSGIPLVDMGAASMKMNEDGSFNLLVGATDLGTGSDTVLAQIAAEVLKVPLEKIVVFSSDTDMTPFDTGAYASSTTYVSGGAVKKCALRVARQIIEVAARMMGTTRKNLILERRSVLDIESGEEVSFEEIALRCLYQEHQFQIQAQASNVESESPPPFVAQFAEVEVDERTGRVKVIKLVSAVDCGQPINPRLVEGQVEGAVAQGLGFALWEECLFDDIGRMRNASFGEYKIPGAPDMPEIETIIASSFEWSGPFGAKSVSEVPVNGVAPAIANAIYDAVGIRLFELPFTPERVLRELRRRKDAG